MKKPCILVVDDEAALRELITLRLESNGFKVEAVDRSAGTTLFLRSGSISSSSGEEMH